MDKSVSLQLGQRIVLWSSPAERQALLIVPLEAEHDILVAQLGVQHRDPESDLRLLVKLQVGQKRSRQEKR